MSPAMTQRMSRIVRAAAAVMVSFFAALAAAAPSMDLASLTARADTGDAVAAYEIANHYNGRTGQALNLPATPRSLGCGCSSPGKGWRRTMTTCTKTHRSQGRPIGGMRTDASADGGLRRWRVERS